MSGDSSEVQVPTQASRPKMGPAGLTFKRAVTSRPEAATVPQIQNKRLKDFLLWIGIIIVVGILIYGGAFNFDLSALLKFLGFGG